MEIPRTDHARTAARVPRLPQADTRDTARPPTCDDEATTTRASENQNGESEIRRTNEKTSQSHPTPSPI